MLLNSTSNDRYFPEVRQPINRARRANPRISQLPRLPISPEKDYSPYNVRSMPTPHDKGEALEAAVAAIEELILQTSPASAAQPIVEKKKIIQVGGVRHEIDVHVTINPALGYESTYIFECKNWQDAVGKNEIIVFSEKIDASNAARGYFVAKAFSSDAEAQAKKDPRLILLLATEHDPATPAPIAFFARFPQLQKVRAKLSVRGTRGVNIKTIKVEEARTIYLGTDINLLKQVDAWSKEACDENVAKSNSEMLAEGTHEKAIDCERRFPPGDLTVDEQDIEKIDLHIEYKMTVEKSRMISHFEVQSRGRFFRFAPLTAGGATIEGYIIFSTPAEIRPKI